VRVIYEPRGRAREYAELAVSLYKGCAHACRYCFNEENPNALPRDRVLEYLEKDLAAMRAPGDDRIVLMSFGTDPYQPVDEELKLTREGLLLFLKYGRKVDVLTKGGTRSTRDFDLMERFAGRCRYATTLVFTDQEQEAYWEPHAAPTWERMLALAEAHTRGIPTWVSLEPLYDPNQTLALLHATLPYADEYRLGILNHMEPPEKIDYGKFLKNAVELLEEHGKRYLIKKDLRIAAGIS
jgi:DNA repair photolyase